MHATLKAPSGTALLAAAALMSQVRYWHLADIQACTDECPLLG
jgi:hypothetical protein